MRDHLDAEPARQAIETDQRHLWTADPGWHELRAEGDDRQERQARRPLDDQVEQLERGGIGRVLMAPMTDPRQVALAVVHLVGVADPILSFAK